MKFGNRAKNIGKCLPKLYDQNSQNHIEIWSHFHIFQLFIKNHENMNAWLNRTFVFFMIFIDFVVFIKKTPYFNMAIKWSILQRWNPRFHRSIEHG